MRFKVVLLSTLVGILVIGLAVWATRHDSTTPTQTAPSEPPPSAPAQRPSQDNLSTRKDLLQPKRPTPEDIQAADQQHEVQIQNAKTAIDQALLNRTDESLRLVLGKLEDADKEVRKAAIQALIALNDREAISALELAISRSDDAEDKAEMQKAIDFLKLPSLSELQP